MASITPSYNREGEHIGWQVAIRKKGFPAQYKTFRTRKEADAWATVAESEMLRGVWRDRSESESTTQTDIATRATPEDEREWGEEMADRGRATFWRFNPDSNVTRQADSYPGLPPLESAH